MLAVEVSRLARSSQDWHRLLSLCAVAETVVVDENAVYDPADKDDKLLLDIKSTMSEAELHWLGLRLVGALQSKARRGELRVSAPTGYVWTGSRLALEVSPWASDGFARGSFARLRRPRHGEQTHCGWLCMRCRSAQLYVLLAQALAPGSTLGLALHLEAATVVQCIVQPSRIGAQCRGGQDIWASGRTDN